MPFIIGGTRVKDLILSTAIIATGHLASAQQPFLDCAGTFSGYLDDSSTLEYIKGVHEAKQFKFSSECLELLLKRNFAQSADYLMDEYYPSTQIDTEIIVNAVQADVKRQQNYVLYRLLKAK